MKKVSCLCMLLISFLGIQFVHAQSVNTAQGDAILGEWVNAKGDAKFKIYASDNKYFGSILWGTGRETKDVKNPDTSLRNRELVGLTILNDFVYEGSNVWANGTIYDPNDGKTYSCKLTLKSPDKLDVRGYVGISLFGRTETWTRIK